MNEGFHILYEVEEIIRPLRFSELKRLENFKNPANNYNLGGVEFFQRAINEIKELYKLKELFKRGDENEL